MVLTLNEVFQISGSQPHKSEMTNGIGENEKHVSSAQNFADFFDFSRIIPFFLLITGFVYPFRLPEITKIIQI